MNRAILFTNWVNADVDEIVGARLRSAISTLRVNPEQYLKIRSFKGALSCKINFFDFYIML